MKKRFWFSTTVVLFLFSSILIFALRNARIKTTSIIKEYRFYTNELNSVMKRNELKVLPPMNSRNKYINPGNYLPVWNDTTIYIRIHDSICVSCSSYIFNYIVNNYSKSRRYKLHVLGSYTMHHNFIGDLQKLGLEKLSYLNSADQLGFISADSLNNPYIFTISDSKISSMIMLSSAQNDEIDAYFRMVIRIIDTEQ